jgi:hypothetical protein
MPLEPRVTEDRIVLRQPTDSGDATVCRSAAGSFVLRIGTRTLGHTQTLVGALDMAERCLPEKIRRGDWLVSARR